MVSPLITVDTSATAAAFAAASLAYRYPKSAGPQLPGNADNVSDRLARTIDWLEATVVDLQSRLAALALLSGNITGADLTATDMLQGARLNVAGGTALNGDGTDFVLSAGWGVGRAIEAASVVGTASAFVIGNIFPAGTPAANPTVTLTFPGGARASLPLLAIPVKYGFNATAGAHSWTVDSLTTTSMRLVHVGTPVADEGVGVAVVIIG